MSLKHFNLSVASARGAMPTFCCVVNCGSQSNRDALGFYRIPAFLGSIRSQQLTELSTMRRERWINAFKRIDLTPVKLRNARVCSRHFISGRCL